MRERQLQDLCFELAFICLVVMVWGREREIFLLPNPALLAGLRGAAGAIPSCPFPHHLDRREQQDSPQLHWGSQYEGMREYLTGPDSLTQKQGKKLSHFQ